MVSESVQAKDSAGKTVFNKTGNKVENSTYTIKTLEEDKLIFLSSENQYRNLEGKRIDLEVDLVHDDFKSVNKIKFVAISLSPENKA